MHLYPPSTSSRQCSQHDLPPKLLTERNRRELIKRHVLMGLSVFFALACLATAVALLVVARMVNTNRDDPSLQHIDENLVQALYQGPQHSDVSCNLATSDSAAQQFFMVDLPVYFRTQDTQATYADAKVIDMAWNLLFGQGGRLLHGWFLCSYIIPDAFTLLLERSGLSYATLLDLFFVGASLKTLWSLCKMLGRWRTLPTLLWTLIALTYVLLFPTIWDAATGYFQPSVSVFKMPDGSYLDGSSYHLRDCFVLNDTRLPIPPQVLVNHMDEEVYGAEPKESVSLLLGIEAYAWTMADVRAGALLRCAQNKSQEHSRPSWTIGTSVNFTDFSATEHTDFPYIESMISRETPSCGLAPSASLSVAHRTAHLGNGTVSGTLLWHYEYNYTDVTMTLDPSVTAFPPGTLPYNSTLWLNGTRIDLSAPTLDLMRDCFARDGQICTCYDSTPITYDYTTPEHTQCLSISGYSWGFSTGVAILAISLEIAWIIGCYGIWLDAQLNSKLVRMRRRAAGEVRNILDFAARIQRDLGTNTIGYSEKELRRALEKCGDVGHSLGEEDRDGEPAIGILTAEKVSPTGNRVWHLKRRRKDGVVENSSGEDLLAANK